MTANPKTAAPPGRKKLARGKERSAAAPGHASPNTSGPEGAREGKTVPLAELSEARVAQDAPSGHGQFTYVDISSIDRETKRIVDPKILPAAKAPSRARQVLRSGDVLVSMTRPNLNAVGLVPPDLDGSIGSTGFHVLRAKDAEPKFLFYAVQTPAFINAMCEKVQGALYPAVRPKDISSFILPIFSLPAQRAAVAEIEKQFTRLNAGVTALWRVQANLKRYRAAILKAACEGRLTDESNGQSSLPTALLDLAQPEDAIVHAEQTLPSLPSRWRWVQVGKVFQTRQGVQIPKSQQREAPSPGFQRYLYISDFKHSESLKFVEDKYPGQKVTERDLVMANTGSPGEVFRGTNGILSNNLFRISFDQETFVQRFVYYYFKSPLFISRIKLKGGAQQHLGHRTIAAHLMPLPPLAEQTRIVAEVERRLSVVEELETVASVNLQRASRLRQTVLHSSFGGRLWNPT